MGSANDLPASISTNADAIFSDATGEGSHNKQRQFGRHSGAPRIHGSVERVLPIQLGDVFCNSHNEKPGF
jgi:hypothetical protein